MLPFIVLNVYILYSLYSSFHQALNGVGKRAQDEAALKSLIQRHLKWTGSAVARAILDDWPAAKGRFWKVFPHEYASALREQAAAAAAATADERAVAEYESAGKDALSELRSLAEAPTAADPQVRNPKP